MSNPTEPILLLDESLAPSVAAALRLVGYDFRDVISVFGAKGIQDPEIIAWCGDNGAVWIHADDRARRQHSDLLQTSGVRTIWVRRPGGRMERREQLRILAYVLPRLMVEWERRPRVRHYRATAATPLSNPSLRPERI